MGTRRRNRRRPGLVALVAVLGCAWPAHAEGLGFWGRVIDEDTGRPMTGVDVRAPNGDVLVTTDGDGYFWLPARPESLRVGVPGYQELTVRPAAPGLSVRANAPDATGPVPLRASGEILALVPIRRPLPAARLRLGWAPDLLRETFVGSGGRRFDLDGMSLAAGQIQARADLGGVLLEGTATGRAYTLRQGFWGENDQRWQQEVTVGALWPLALGERLFAAVGPALYGGYTGLLTAPDGRMADDDLAAARTRWGLGGLAEVACALPVGTPLAVEARFGLWPVAGTLGAGPASRVPGQWCWQGGVGLRWMPWPRFGLELRYQAQGWHADAWQGALVDQLGHGLTLGTVIAF